MRCLAILLFCSATLTAAADEQLKNFRNALGWDNGIAYRRYMKNGFFIGVSLQGSTSKSYDQADVVSYESGEDDVINHTKVNRSGVSYTTLANFQMGKKIIQHRWMAIRFLLYPEYEYRWYDSWGTAVQNRWQWIFSAGGFIGFEPSFTVLQRFTFGTRFGLKGTYSWSKQSSSSADKTSDETRNRYDVTIIGKDLSASMRLFGYYEF